MLSREIEKNCRSCWKCRAWAAHGITGLRKHLFLAIEPFKKNCKNLSKSSDFRNISQNSSVFALPVVGVNAQGVNAQCKNCGKSAKWDAFRVFFDVLLLGGFAAKCTIFRKYISHFSLIFEIIRNSRACFCKSLQYTLWCTAKQLGWRWSFGHSAPAAQREMTWRQNWMSHTACHYFSACERCTLSWTQYSSGNPHARIYTPEQPALSLQWIVWTYQEIVLSLVPFQNLLHRHNWKTNCCPSRKRIVVHNCLPDRPPR